MSKSTTNSTTTNKKKTLTTNDIFGISKKKMKKYNSNKKKKNSRLSAKMQKRIKEHNKKKEEEEQQQKEYNTIKKMYKQNPKEFEKKFPGFAEQLNLKPKYSIGPILEKAINNKNTNDIESIISKIYEDSYNYFLKETNPNVIKFVVELAKKNELTKILKGFEKYKKTMKNRKKKMRKKREMIKKKKNKK